VGTDGQGAGSYAELPQKPREPSRPLRFPAFRNKKYVRSLWDFID